MMPALLPETPPRPRRARRRLVLLTLAVVLVASEAQAWQVVGQALFEVSSRSTFEFTSQVTFESTTDATTKKECCVEKERRARQAEEVKAPPAPSDGGAPEVPPGREGAPCESDLNCYGACREGKCVPTQLTLPECRTGSDCKAGQRCQDSKCIDADAPVRPAGVRCRADQDCEKGETCANGQCQAIPPPPPATLWQRGSELYLRTWAVQLRQDLALGSGPVVATLAAVNGVSPVVFGQTLRAHRAELISLMGDGSDEQWPGRFLQRVEELKRACPSS